ncbi:stalk domain-containing protein [Paenibacillus sp. CF384]|uniref:stalk domain-containing protein n=1 Tax=Paenibacillus sp. CF384 TaxID=1884382 RepID=UPI0008982821|nr:stalk domain-containing protein [Paenibacillus sp. CF384]SDW46995.1 Carboxypeptidase regulatory-like domain-containing protein [Paenibacillus sp. CF384]
MIHRFMLCMLGLSLLLLHASPNVQSAAQSPQFISVYVEGVPVAMTAKPYIARGVTMVPFRAIFEALNLKVTWDKTTGTVIGSNAWTEIELKVGSLPYRVNGNWDTMQVPIEIKDGAAYIPLRFVGEETGNDVTWHAANRRIDIRAGHATKGKLYTADGRETISGKQVRLLVLKGDELLQVAEVQTGPNGEYRFEGLVTGSDYVVEGSWPEDADIHPCAFRFHVSGNCARLAVASHQAAIQVLSPGGNPMVAGELQVAISENGLVTSYMGQAGGLYVTDLLEDGHTYTITAQLPDTWSDRYAVPEPYTFTYYEGVKIQHQFVLSKLTESQVTGRITDETEKPVAAINVSLTTEPGQEHIATYISKKDGSFSFRGLEKGHSYWLNVYVPLSGRTGNEKPTIGALLAPIARKITYDGSLLQLGNVKLNRIQLIAKVVDAKGNPQSAISMLQNANGQKDGQAVFAGKGYIAAGGMTEGERYTWKVMIGDFGHASGMNVKVSQKEYTFVYRPGMEEHTFTADN